jgi:uroporphyrinogen-III decarboxylase
MLIGLGVSGAKMSGTLRVFIPLHRGADGFLSLKQFETFYWPGLKRLMLTLIDEGITPCPFFEGDYTSRLKYLADLPKGKVLGLFDATDIFKAKEILGGTMCISGMMPLSLLQVGTPEKIKDYAKKLIDVVGKGGGFIMGPRSAMDECDPDLVKVWVEFTKEYGVYH